MVVVGVEVFHCNAAIRQAAIVSQDNVFTAIYLTVLFTNNFDGDFLYKV
jgi:hypothetical protein